MKNKISLIKLSCIIILLCGMISCKKDHAAKVNKVAASPYDYTQLHLIANVSDGSFIKWDEHTSEIIHVNGKHRTGSRPLNLYMYVHSFSIQNSDGSGIGMSNQYMCNSNGDATGSGNSSSQSFVYKGKTYQFGSSNIKLSETIIVNSEERTHFKGDMKFYKYFQDNTNNKITDSLELTNVDWVYIW